MKKQGNELFVNLSLVIDYLNARGGSKQPASSMIELMRRKLYKCVMHETD